MLQFRKRRSHQKRSLELLPVARCRTAAPATKSSSAAVRIRRPPPPECKCSRTTCVSVPRLSLACKQSYIIGAIVWNDVKALLNMRTYSCSSFDITRIVTRFTRSIETNAFPGCQTNFYHVLVTQTYLGKFLGRGPCNCKPQKLFRQLLPELPASLQSGTVPY